MSHSPSAAFPPSLSAALLQRLLTVPTSSSSSSTSFAAFRPRGLVNVSNRCFVNASLQLLLTTLPFLAYFASIAEAASTSPAAELAELSIVAPTFSELLHFLRAYRAEAAEAPPPRVHTTTAEQTTVEETKSVDKKSTVVAHVDEGREGKEEQTEGEEEAAVGVGDGARAEDDGGAVAAGGSASRRRRRRRQQRAAQGGGDIEAPPLSLPRAQPSTSAATTAAAASSNLRPPLQPRPLLPSTSSKATPSPTPATPPRSPSPALLSTPLPSFSAAPFAPSFSHLLSSFQKQQVGRQEDAAELLHFLLDRLQGEALALQRLRDALTLSTEDGQWSHSDASSSASAAADEWKEIGRKSRQLIVRPSALLSLTPISALCGLRLRSCLHIPQRHKDSVSWQAALMLPLDVPVKAGSLEASLVRFFSTTEVSSHRSRGAAQTQTLDSHSLPPALILHLKRFAYSADGHAGGESRGFHKLHSHVAFPLCLSLPPSILHGWPPHPGATPPRYELASVLVHHGDTPQSGHYTAFVRHPATDPSASSASTASSWLSIDDTTVKAVSTAVVLAQTAYLLTFVAQQLPR